MLCNSVHVMMSIPKEFRIKFHSYLLNTKVWMDYLDYKIPELLTFGKAVRYAGEIKFWFWESAWAFTTEWWT